ncbi:MAG TPA: hydrogenase maturation protease [Rhodocyclaceae bacterium]|nr:hydrogenase maturation protease [Rhodocyclaceae bacterium]
MQAGTVIFSAGNRSRGDDALGPLLLERLAAWLVAEYRDAEFELIDDYQLQIEHALDLQGRRLALFIDAGCRTPAPLEFYAIAPAPVAAASSTHALSPQAVLDVYRQIALGDPPPSFVLCVRGERFELGAGLSPSAERHMEAAWRQLTLLCAQPDAARWRAMAKAPINVPLRCTGTA